MDRGFHGAAGRVGFLRRTYRASLATILYVWKNKLPLWKFSDTLAPSIALGYVPGRLGCLMNGCCYGKPTGLPWALHFPPGHETNGVGVHPTQIYDALLNFGLYLGLAWLFRRKKFDGQVFAAYLLCYAVTPLDRRAVSRGLPCFNILAVAPRRPIL
jgi:prolipoprotein diacylglyceryltransferase